MSELPAPDGEHFCGAEAWWRLSSGDLLFANPGEVFTSTYDPRALCAIEQDALASLAAVRWARGASQTPADTVHGFSSGSTTHPEGEEAHVIDQG